MFNVNNFKAQIKGWIKANPTGSEQCLRDYCEELIPTQHYASHGWLVEQTVQWFKHVKAQKDLIYFKEDDLEEVA